MSTNLAPLPAKPTGVEYAAQMTNWVRNVPARINDSSIAVVKKAGDTFGEFGAAMFSGSVAIGAGLMAGGYGAKLASFFVGSGYGVVADWTTGLGFAAAAVPAVTGWVHSIFKDGAARGVLEGAAVTAGYFGGHAIAYTQGWGAEAGNWTGFVLGALAAVGCIAGLVKRHS